MHLTSLPAVIAEALPHATATTIEIILAPRCHIRVIDGPELWEADVERIDSAILLWRATLASQVGILVTGLQTQIPLSAIPSEQDAPMSGLEWEDWRAGIAHLFGYVAHLSAELVNADGEVLGTLSFQRGQGG